MLQYQTTTGKTLTIPQNWDEMSLLQQEIAISKIRPMVPKLYMKNEKGKDELVSNELHDQLHILTLQLLLNMKPNEFFKFPNEDIFRLINKEKVTLFIFKDRGPLSLKANKWKGLKGPGEKLNGITAEEIFILGKFYTIIKKGNPEALYPFLATVFRHTDKTGKRHQFDLSTVHLREKKVKTMPIAHQLLTVAWYEANMERLAAANPHAFEGKGKEEGDFLELLLQLAKDGPFGDFNKTRQASAEVLFKELNRVAKEQKQIQAKTKA